MEFSKFPLSHSIAVLPPALNYDGTYLLSTVRTAYLILKVQLEVKLISESNGNEIEIGLQFD